MSIDENENRPESDDRAIQVKNCTIYVGHVRIVIDPRLNADVASITETRATEAHDGQPSANTSSRQTNFVSVHSTKPRSQRQPFTMPYAAQLKTTKAGQTSRQQSVSQRPVTSQLSCCMHGSGRCNYEARFNAGSDKYIAGGTDDCPAAARNGDPSRRVSSRRSPIWGTQNGGRLSPLRLVYRDKNAAKSDRLTALSRIPMPRLSQPVRQDRPVELYAGSRLPVPVRPGSVAPRVLQVGRADDERLPSRDDGRSDCRCATADRPHDTDANLSGRRSVTADKPFDADDKPHDTDEQLRDNDDKPHDTGDKQHDTDDQPHDIDDKQHGTANGLQDINDGQHDVDDRLHEVVGLLDYDDTAVEPGRPCTPIDELSVSLTYEQQCALQALDDCSSTGSRAVAVDSDNLSDASDHPSLQPVGQNESGIAVPT